MPTPISNDSFATQFATLLGLNSTDTASLVSLVESWDPNTPSDVAQIVTDFVDNAGVRDSNYNAWWTGTAGGGPNNNGTYPLTLFGGGTITLPCPAQMLSVTQKGDPGLDGGIKFTFDIGTADADPGSGKFRFNNAAPASTTFIYISNNESGGTNVSAWEDSLDDSTSTPKGRIFIRQNPSGLVIFNITGAVVVGTGYRKIPVTYVAGSGALTATQTVLADAPAGTKGDQGIQGNIGNTGPTGPAAWGTPAAWVTAHAYSAGPPASVVTQGGNTYVCLVSHTSGTFATDLAASKWLLVASKGDQGIQGNIGNTGPTGPAAWSTPAAWATTTVYSAGPPASVVTNGGNTYVCAVTHTSGTFATDLGAGKWTLVAAKGADGTGVGNVNHTGAVTAGHVAVFSDTTGNLIQDGGVAELQANKGVANGYAGLDSGGKVPTTQLPASVLGAMEYQSTWNASTNSPAIPAAAAGNKGWYYIVATAGATSVSGITDWQVGDWLVSDGTNWDKIDNTDQVLSVAGLMGTITATALKTALSLTSADVGLGNVDNTHVVGKQGISIPAVAFKPRNTNGAQGPNTVETTTNKVIIETLDFDPSTAQYAQYRIRLNKSVSAASLTAQLVFTQAAAGTGNVVWAVQALAVSDGDAQDTAFGTAQSVTKAGGTVGTAYQTAETAAITPSNTPAQFDELIIQVYRDAANASDTLTVNACLQEVIIYLTTTAGSDA